MERLTLPTASLSRPVLARQAGWALLLALAILAGRASRVGDSQLAIVWPAAAVSVVWLLGAAPGRPLVRTAVAMSGLIAVVNLLTGTGALGAVLFSGVNVAHALAGVLVLRRAGWTGRRALTSVADGAALAAASLTAAAVSAGLGALSAAWSFGEPLGSTAGLLLLRNLVSTGVLGAALLSLPSVREEWRRRGTSAHELALLLSTAAVLYTVAFGAGVRVPIAFTVLPVWVWVGARMPTAPAAVAVALSGVPLVLLAELSSRSSDVLVDVTSRVLVAQAFLAVTALVALGLALSTSERVAALGEARRSSARLQQYLDVSLVGAAVVDLSADAVLRSVNPALSMLLARPAQELVGHRWEELVQPGSADELAAALAEMRAGTRFRWSGAVEHRLPGAGTRWVEVSVAAVPDDAEAAVSFMDLTAHRDEQDRLRQQALHDDLTGLPHRALLLERTADALATAGASPPALLFVDVDRFKAVNDSLGHHVGDQVLALVGRRLQAVVRPGDTVARVGGDEFVVLCPTAGTPEDAERLAERVRAEAQRPLELPGGALSVGLSVGVALARPGDTVEELLQRADTAMFRVKHGARAVVPAQTRAGDTTPRVADGREPHAASA